MKKNKLLYIGHPKTIMAIDASTNSMAFSIFKEGVLHKFGKINFHGKHVYEKAGDACNKLIPFLKDFDIRLNTKKISLSNKVITYLGK